MPFYGFLDELEAQNEELMMNNTCTFLNDEPNVVAFYNDLEVTENVEFSPGAVIISRLVGILMAKNLKKCQEVG